jgi:hypothetical protein
VQPKLLRDVGIYGGAQGVWVDKEQSVAAAPRTGVAVGLLHTGSAYADDLADDGVIYHYPSSNRRGKDRAEIAAVKAAGDLRLPVFVIIYSGPGASRRDVRLGWVEGADDRARLETCSGQVVMAHGDAFLRRTDRFLRRAGASVTHDPARYAVGSARPGGASRHVVAC